MGGSRTGRWATWVVPMLALALAAGPQGVAATSLPAWAKGLAGKIKHIIVLMEENRSFDHMFGFAKKLKVDGLMGDEGNLINLSNPSQGEIKVSPTGRYVNPCDPDHGTPATTFKIADNMGGFVAYENNKGHGTSSLNYCDVMSAFESSKLPVITTLAEEYALMDRMFCSHPGPTWPNRLFALSATTLGETSTGTWYNGTPGKLFPQKTFFDQVEAVGMTWKNYYNDTPWELFVEKIAHNPDNVAPLTELFEDAAAGTLPSYAWINPRCGMNVTTGQGSNDQHPDHDVALGEALMKDIYESLRASPQWNETLFIITYDEHGGFYDHVVPPQAPPPGDSTRSYPDDFDFTRLGVRIPTLLISPWIERGTVLSEPPALQRPANDSQYDLTSIMATARKLLGMPHTPLTNRDAWAGTFEHVISRDTPRTDCLAHLPAAPDPDLTPEAEAALPLNDLQRQISEVHAHVLGGDGAAASAAEVMSRPQGHVSSWVQSTYEEHAKRTVEWRASKEWAAASGLTVMTRPGSMKGWQATFQLSFNGGASAVQTIHTTLAGDSLCLEWQGEVQRIGYSKCYPSADPVTSRDPDQQWMALPDTTIRPAAHRDHCLSNVLTDPAGDMAVYNVTVLPCDGRFEQHWGVGVVNPTDKASSLGFATSESLGLV